MKIVEKAKSNAGRNLAILALILMMFTAAFVLTNECDESSADGVTSGSCGDNLTWSYDTNTKTLTITGTGAMTDYEMSSSPWHQYSALKSLSLPDGLTTIGSWAFSYCTKLTSMTIPSSVTSIGDYAFRECYELMSMTIPSSVTSIGEGAFYGYRGSGFVVSENNPKYCSYNGWLCSKNIDTIIACSIDVTGSLTIPSSVTSIGGWAFYGCTGLTGSLTIPSSVTSIGSSEFRGCSGLTSVTIPSSVTSIGEGAFWGCSGLTSVTIPSSVTSIGSGAFQACTGLTGSLTIPSSVTSIGHGAFLGCSGLTGSLTIPSSMTLIEYWTFWGCSGLTSVTIPSSVTYIGSSAFQECSGLTSVTIPSSVTYIEDKVFYGSTFYAEDGTTELSQTVENLAGYTFSGIWTKMIRGSTPVPSYIVTLSKDFVSGGTVTGAGTYDNGKIVTVTATANTGYIFSGWYDASTKISSNSNYSFTITSDTSLTAKFTLNAYTVTLSKNPTAGGTVTGAGTYSHGTEITIVASAAEGYNFAGWYNLTTSVSGTSSYTFTVTGDVSYIAKFTSKPVETFTVTLSADPFVGGTVTGAGVYISYNTTTITAVPNEGYTFDGWYNGSILVSKELGYTFEISSNISYTASFSDDSGDASSSNDIPWTNVAIVIGVVIGVFAIGALSIKLWRSQ